MKQFAICLGVFAILLLKVMELLCVVRGALVPLSMSLDFSMYNLTKFKGRKFNSRPKWHSATSTMIEKYINKVD